MAPDPDPSAVITAIFGDTVSRTPHTYPRPLPAELAPWYAYFDDAGHSIIIAVESMYDPKLDPAEYLCPASVKSVLRAGWTRCDGLIVCDLPYSTDLGLMCPVDEYEY